MDKSVEDLVEQRIAELRGKPVADLLRLPKCEKETIKVDGKEVEVFTMHETSDAGRKRFIVQAIRPRWGGITAKVVARGFEVSSDQSFRTLEPEELYNFT